VLLNLDRNTMAADLNHSLSEIESEKFVTLDRHRYAMSAIRLRLITQNLSVETGAGSSCRTIQKVDDNLHFTAFRHLPRHSQVQARGAHVVENAIDDEWKSAAIIP